MLVDGAVVVAQSTIKRWVIRYEPDFEKLWRMFSRSVGCSWRVDETYIAVKGNWHYLYRAVDKHGVLSKNWNEAVTLLFGSRSSAFRRGEHDSRSCRYRRASAWAGGAIDSPDLD